MKPRLKIALLLGLFLLLGLSFVSLKATNQVIIHYFYDEACSHCQDASLYLDQIEAENPFVIVERYDVGRDDQAKDLFRLVKDTFHKNMALTPFIVIRGVALVGYSDQIEADISSLVERFETEATTDVVMKLIDGEAVSAEEIEFIRFSKGDYVFLPLLKEVPIDGLSLLVGAIVIGFVDGFNPCAMWILLFLVAMLFNLKNRTRMWLLGLLFLLSSALVYFLIMTAWLNLSITVRDVLWFRILIGVFAIGFGAYNLTKTLKKTKDNMIGCEVTDASGRKRIRDKISEVIERRSLLLASIGIIALGAFVNLIELACSAGLPLLYTQILAYNELPAALNYGYIAIYVFFYMLDDLVIFFIAMFTLKLTGISNRYQVPSRIVGAVIMIVLGVLLIFFPGIIMFA